MNSASSRAAGPLQNRRDQVLDRLRFTVVEIEGLDTVGFERGDVVGLARRREDAPAFGLERTGAIGADAGRGAGDDDGAQRPFGRTS